MIKITLSKIVVRTKGKKKVLEGYIATARGLRVSASYDHIAVGELAYRLRKMGLADSGNTSERFMHLWMHQTAQVWSTGAYLLANPERYGFSLKSQETVLCLDLARKKEV